ncbi:hypothetical protein LSAT2_009857 [Lamellibrachia satsuma]|nr:hypothetical protein LSAT2_009857 [Lamellibrachia satsuma]
MCSLHNRFGRNHHARCALKPKLPELRAELSKEYCPHSPGRIHHEPTSPVSALTARFDPSPVMTRSGWTSSGQRLLDLYVLIGITLWWTLHGTNAQIKCYFCMYAPVSRNFSCLMPMDSTEGIQVVECPDYSFCSIRSYFRNGQVVEFTRTCEVETSSRIDQCFITSSSSECQKFCKTDLCNTGDGKVGGGSIALTPTGRLVALLAVVGTLLADWCK